MIYKIKIDGMGCQHCVNAVTEALFNVESVAGVVVKLEEGLALVEAGSGIEDAAKAAIEDAGYDVTEITKD